MMFVECAISYCTPTYVFYDLITSNFLLKDNITIIVYIKTSREAKEEAASGAPTDSRLTAAHVSILQEPEL